MVYSRRELGQIFFDVIKSIFETKRGKSANQNNFYKILGETKYSPIIRISNSLGGGVYMDLSVSNSEGHKNIIIGIHDTNDNKEYYLDKSLVFREEEKNSKCIDLYDLYELAESHVITENRNKSISKVLNDS